MIGKIEQRQFDSFFMDTMSYVDEILSCIFQYPELEDDVQRLYTAMYGALKDIGESDLDFTTQAMMCIECIAATQQPIEEQEIDWMTQFSINMGINCLSKGNLQAAANAI